MPQANCIAIPSKAATQCPRVLPKPSQKPKLLDRLREALSSRHYSRRTEQTYCHWVKQFIFFDTPIGIALAIKLVPHQVLAECRARAQETIQNGKPVSRVAGAVIIVIWLVLAALGIVWTYEAFMPQ